MKKKITVFIVFCLLATGMVFNSPVAYAQFPEDEPSPEKREKIRKRIETLRMWKLTQALDLDEVTSAKLFPVLNKYDKKRAKIQQEVRENMRELRQSLQFRQDESLQAIIDVLEQKHKELRKIMEQEHSELKTILSPRQQAQMIFFQMEFNKEVRKMIGEAREKRRERFPGERRERP